MTDAEKLTLSRIFGLWTDRRTDGRVKGEGWQSRAILTSIRRPYIMRWRRSGDQKTRGGRKERANEGKTNKYRAVDRSPLPLSSFASVAACIRWLRASSSSPLPPPPSTPVPPFESNYQDDRRSVMFSMIDVDASDHRSAIRVLRSASASVDLRPFSFVSALFNALNFQETDIFCTQRNERISWSRDTAQ